MSLNPQADPTSTSPSAQVAELRQTSRVSRRSRRGCLTCRERKVKCDETPNHCNHCTRLGFNCVWPVQQSRRDRSSHRSRSPVRLADERPRSSRHDQGGRDHMPANQAYTHELSRNVDTSKATSLYDMSSEYNLDILLSAYFSRIHPIQANGFMHRPTLEREIRQKSAHPLTVKAICAAAAGFLVRNHHSNQASADQSSRPTDPESWVEDVKGALMYDTERIGYPKLIAALCVIQYEFGAGRNASAWTICALAVRLALAMGLNNEESRESPTTFVEKEFRRRLMWSVYACDCMCHGGLDDYMLLSHATMRIPLPASEHHYSLAIEPPERPRLQDVSRSIELPSHGADGLMSRYVRLMSIRTSVLRYVKNVTHHTTVVWDPSSPFHEMVSELKCWKDTLPVELHLTLDNLYARRTSHELGALCLLHCWHDQLHCSLYRIALPGFDESAPASYLADAPPGWVDKLRQATYVRASALLHKFSILRQSFPEHVPESWQFATLALEATRNILQYLAITYPGGLDQEKHQSTLLEFTDMVETVAKMENHLRGIRVKVRDLIRILDRHGFRVDVSHIRTSPGSVRAATPARGPILSRLPMFRRHLRHPELDGQPAISPSDCAAAATIDPVSQEPIQTSPVSNTPQSLATARSPHAGLQPRDPMSDNPLVMTPAEYLSWLPSQETSGGGLEPDDSLWLQMGGAEIPGFNLDGFADTWTATGFPGLGEDGTEPESHAFWSS